MTSRLRGTVCHEGSRWPAAAIGLAHSYCGPSHRPFGDRLKIAPLPAACETEDRRAQNRFYQRGFAPDDFSDDDLWQLSDFVAQGINPGAN